MSLSEACSNLDFFPQASQNGVDLTPHPHSEGAFLVAQLVKNPPAMQETWVRSLGREDPLEKGKATHSGILVWRIPWTVKTMVSQSWTQLRDFDFTSTFRMVRACYCFSKPHGVAVGTLSCIISQAGRDPWEYLKENEPLPQFQLG